MARRLQTEFKNISKRRVQDYANFIAVPEEKDIFTWHFLLFGLQDCPYEGGFFWGKLRFPKDYPFKPPRILMNTPSGRFEVQQPICTSFSDYHPESWDPSWSVQTIVLGLISFMLSEELTAGGLRAADSKRRQFAKQSLEFNFKKEKEFTELFGTYFDKIGIDPKTKTSFAVNQEESKQGQAEQTQELLAQMRAQEKVSNDQSTQVMTMQEFDNFLTEMGANKQYVLILDFTSLGGSLGFTEEEQQKLISQGFESDFYHLKIPFNPLCQFASIFEVKSGPQMVAISVQNKKVFTKDTNELSNFLKSLKEGGESQAYLLARKESQEAKEEQQRKEKEKMQRNAARAEMFLKKRAEKQAAAEEAKKEDQQNQEQEKQKTEAEKKDEAKPAISDHRRMLAEARAAALRKKKSVIKDEEAVKKEEAPQISEQRQQQAQARLAAMQNKEKIDDSNLGHFNPKDLRAHTNREVAEARARGLQAQREQMNQMSTAIAEQEEAARIQKQMLQEEKLNNQMNRAALQASRMQLDKGDNLLQEHFQAEITAHIEPHKKWLMNQLYEDRQTDGDVVLSFKSQEGQEQEQLRCHSQVLISQSEYFRGLIEFRQAQSSEETEIVHEVKDHDPILIKKMLEFFYLGETKISSEYLIDMLNLCDEYLLPSVKMVVEQELVKNLRQENYHDMYMIAKGYGCLTLMEKLVEFGRTNVWALRQAGVLKQLDEEEKVRILRDNPNNKAPKEKPFSFMGK